MVSTSDEQEQSRSLAAWERMNDTLDGYHAGTRTEAEYRQAFDEWAQIAQQPTP